MTKSRNRRALKTVWIAFVVAERKVKSTRNDMPVWEKKRYTRGSRALFTLSSSGVTLSAHVVLLLTDGRKCIVCATDTTRSFLSSLTVSSIFDLRSNLWLVVDHTKFRNVNGPHGARITNDHLPVLLVNNVDVDGILTTYTCLMIFFFLMSRIMCFMPLQSE